MSKIDGYVKRRETLMARYVQLERAYPQGVVDKAALKELDETSKQIKNLDRKIESLRAEKQRSSK